MVFKNVPKAYCSTIPVANDGGNAACNCNFCSISNKIMNSKYESFVQKLYSRILKSVL